MEAIAEISKKYGVYIVYGLVEKNVNAGPDDYPAYDSAAICGPKGIIGVYRKTHLAPVELYEKGEGPVAFHTPWGPVGVTICYDNYSYHELHRTYALMGARLVLNATNIFYTPDMKDNFFLESQYHKGLQSLVGENWSYIASANNLGWSKSGLWSFGKSEIIGPAKLAMAPTYEPVYYAGPASDKEEIIMAKLDLSYTDKLREWGRCFLPDEKHHNKPTFEVMTYIKWWLPEDKTVVDKNQLNALTQEKEKIAQTRDILVIAAAVLLISTIVFAVLAFKPRKK
jgi:predicted amidohydrolase